MSDITITQASLGFLTELCGALFLQKITCAVDKWWKIKWIYDYFLVLGKSVDWVA
jgi:hypothetical protein